MVAKNRTAERLKQAFLYLCVFMLFKTVFGLLIPYYIDSSSGMENPIDARITDYKFFDADYVQKAKNNGYHIDKYFESFFPLDLVFPAFYTLMFLSILQQYKNKNYFKWFRYIVFAGMIFDYLENFTFATYLKSSLELSSLVAFFTTIKGFLFLINAITFIVMFIWYSILFIKQNRVATASV